MEYKIATTSRKRTVDLVLSGRYKTEDIIYKVKIVFYSYYKRVWRLSVYCRKS